jgi:hypothetical protein
MGELSEEIPPEEDKLKDRSITRYRFLIWTDTHNPYLWTYYTVKKSLFVLASHQKIPVLRTKNPAVDTRTINLPPVEFFKITHARKAMAGKSQPSGLWREPF